MFVWNGKAIIYFNRLAVKSDKREPKSQSRAQNSKNGQVVTRMNSYGRSIPPPLIDEKEQDPQNHCLGQLDYQNRTRWACHAVCKDVKNPEHDSRPDEPSHVGRKSDPEDQLFRWGYKNQDENE